MSDSPTMAQAVRALLGRTPQSALPLTYQQVAQHLGLTPPRTIQQVTQALEQTMREDAASGQAFIAALVVSKRDQLPAAGFFELAETLGRLPVDASRPDVWRDEYVKVLDARRAP